LSLITLATLTAAFAAAGVQGVELEYEMFSDPRVEIPEPIETLRPEYVPLWLQALAGPEADLSREAADTIALAHQSGLRDMSDTAESLLQALQKPGQHPLVVEATVRALVAIDARQAADVLFQQAKRGRVTLAQIVEPALARWDYEPIRAVWLQRLADPNTRRRLLRLAIDGVTLVRDSGAPPRLLNLARSPDAAPDTRLAAARALGRIQTDGLVDEALALSGQASRNGIVDRLVAASMLSGHQSEEAKALLFQLAVDPEPAVAAIALERLVEVDPDGVIAMVDKIIRNEDAKIRHLAARGLAARMSTENVRLLGPMLDDPHPDVRRFVRSTLEDAASDGELAGPVLEEATRMLASDRWRGLEQAAHLLGALDHKPAAHRLVELLEFERSEVFTTAAWALGRLSVPETLDAMYDKSRREIEKGLDNPFLSEALTQQATYLVMALGRLKYAACDPILRRCIPKDVPLAPELRGAAIWALGHIHAGRAEPDLDAALRARATDANELMPEAPLVRFMAAVSLGRMQSKDSLDALRGLLQRHSVNDPLGYASAWAVEQITGEPMPKPEQATHFRTGWFLDPLE
jgi:HEAT repeat protein